tara:strand:+ start:2256 stop:3377 length:1122 start_codon:yes stop_codon:yes gene_type:complete
MIKNTNKLLIELQNKIAKQIGDFKIDSIFKNAGKDNFARKFKNLKITKVKSDYFNPSKLIHYLQDKVERTIKNDSNNVILKQSQFYTRAITWVLMGTTTFAVGWISIAKTDEVVIATGKLAPVGGVVDVQMPLEGVAREILINDGDYVTKGQILIRLDTEISKAKNNALEENLELNEIILKRLGDLVKEGAVSEIQYMQQKSQVIDIKNQIQTNLVRMKYQEIKSPIDGVIFELLPKGPGFVAQTSQPVMKIVPFDNLLAKVEIDSRTIGFVKTGKEVEVSIDSFPASDFGVIEGTVTSIGSDALMPIPSQGKGYRFPAQITLNNQFLELKSGQKLPLQAGMSLTANIKLRKVSYLKLLLNKFGDKAESLKSI